MKNCFTLLVVAFSIAAFSQNEVKFMLTGALAPTSVALRAKLTDTSNNVRVVVSTNNPLTAPFIYSNVSAVTLNNNYVAPFSVTGLSPATKYYYAIESKGVLDDSGDDIGTFTTPVNGPFSYTFMAGSCNREPNTNTYDDFLGYGPLFYLNSGDLHYADPNSVDVNVHRNAYEDRVFTRAKQVSLFRNLPLAYVWDDHDYCGNAADGPAATGAASAPRAYREYIPHYDFPQRTGADSAAIYQSFVIGRVKFIMSDLRSQRDRNNITAMGAAQKQWFKQQLIEGRNNNQLICWVGSYSWYGSVDDNWSLNTAERTELSEFMRDSAIANLFIINGDAHMFAIDNGVNGDFTAAKNLPFRYPVLQAGPIENNGSWKGGTYSEGTFYTFFVKAAQYAVVKVTDNGGDSICVVFDGYKKDLSTGVTTKLVTYDFCRELGAVQTSVIQLEQNSFELFPNPSNGVFNIRFTTSEKATVDVFSVEGKFVKHMDVNDATYHQLDLSGQSSGVYVAKVKTSKGIFAKRLMINR